MDGTPPIEPPPGDSREVEHRAAAWLARRDHGDWSDADADAFEAWLEASPAHRVAVLRLQSAWEECGRLQALAAGRAAGGPPRRGQWATGPWLHRHAPTQPPPAPPAPAGLQDAASLVFARPATATPRHARGRALAALAASTFLAVSFWAGAWRHATVDASSHATPLGSIQSLPLADGSRTVLGSDSRIDVRLSRAERRIDLQRGEAFFEAARDARRPFVVLAGDRRVVAVGTRFSVRRDGADLRVVVTEGSVRLESEPAAGGQRPTALLPAGSVARVTAGRVLVQSGPVEAAERLVGWQDGLLAFRDTTLAEAAAEFNRYNARKIVIADDVAGALRVGGSFRWSNAEGFVRLLEQGFPVRAEYAHGHILLHSR